MPSLLAVDLGLKTGLALFNGDGRLVWYRSHNFGSTERLRRGVNGILDPITDLAYLVLEGGGNLADIWERAAERRQITVLRIAAEVWRQQLLIPREQKTGEIAKQSADQLARQVIIWSKASRPTSLRHDTAEAILVGLWGVLQVGLLEAVPIKLKW